MPGIVAARNGFSERSAANSSRIDYERYRTDREISQNYIQNKAGIPVVLREVTGIIKVVIVF